MSSWLVSRVQVCSALSRLIGPPHSTVSEVVPLPGLWLRVQRLTAGQEAATSPSCVQATLGQGAWSMGRWKETRWWLEQDPGKCAGAACQLGTRLVACTPAGGPQGWGGPIRCWLSSLVRWACVSGDLMSNSRPSAWQDVSAKLTLMVKMHIQNVLLTMSS